MVSRYDDPETVDKKRIRDKIKIESGDVAFSSMGMQVSPPFTSLLMNVDRASSIKRRALAMQRNASLDASGSSLNVTVNPTRVFRLALVARKADPAGSFPRIFTANSAREASFETSLPFGPEPLRSWMMVFIKSTRASLVNEKCGAFTMLFNTLETSVREEEEERAVYAVIMLDMRLSEI